MRQITASFSRTMKEFLREKSAMFWTLLWPVIWVLIGSTTFTASVPEDIRPYANAAFTVSMMVFALMMAGMTNLPSTITQDRENGMLSKLMSMPISPRKDFAGRILALATFSAIATGLVIAVGVASGARFSGAAQVGPAVGFLVLVVGASAGLGLIIGTVIKRQHGAIMTGVGISVITAAVSGIFVPYDMLPQALQQFSRGYPLSSANSSIAALLIGNDYAGYNPLSAHQVTLTISLSLAILIAGIILYSQRAWKSE